MTRSTVFILRTVPPRRAIPALRAKLARSRNGGFLPPMARRFPIRRMLRRLCGKIPACRALGPPRNPNSDSLLPMARRFPKNRMLRPLHGMVPALRAKLARSLTGIFPRLKARRFSTRRTLHRLPLSGRSKYRPHSEQARFSDRLRHEEEPPPGGDGGPTSDGGGASSDKKAARDGRRFEKSKFRAEKTGAKLDAAREKAAAQKPPKPNPAKASVKKAAAGAWYYAHQKIHEVEQENVGVEAAHRTELAGEKTVRGASRFVSYRIQTRPTRRVAKWERRDIRAKADFEYRRMAREHPELKENAVSRFFQKQHIKLQYQKQAREAAKQGARAAGKVTTATAKIARAAAAFVKRHPAGLLIMLIAFLLILVLQSCMASMTTIGNGLIGAVGAGTYPSQDSDMLAAEAAYSGMETKLQSEADNYSTLHSGYDEYHFNLDKVEHDPYVLISILSALHDGAWTLDEVQSTLSTLFGKQYQLTQSVQTETRYRNETSTVTNPDGSTSTVTTQVPYTYTICTVTLHNEDLSHLPVSILTEEQLSRYAFYMKTHGNRTDLFPQSQYPNASSLEPYTDYTVPEAYMSDKTFAAMMAEATKYLGYPYIIS